MERLERIVADRIGRLKQGIESGEALVLQETRQAEQLASDLRTEVAALQSKLKETEEQIERKDASYRQMEETLSGKIKTLENELKRKDEVLAVRDNDIRHQKSKIDVHIKKIGELELANRKTREELSNHGKRAEEFGRISQEKIGALEAELGEARALAEQKSSALKALEEQLAAKNQEIENALKGSRELVASRDAEITDLKSHLQRLLKGIDEMSSLFRQAQALTENNGAPAANQTLPEAEAAPASVEPQAEPVTPVEPRAIAAPEIFQRIIQELAQASNIMGKLASLIVHDQVKALGETMERFPRARLPELIEALAKDIADQNLQTDFRQRVADRTEITLH
jgi:chromosome segregation ATPase